VIPRREALAFWFRLGCIGFGGPAGQIAILHDELVDRRRWISEGRFAHALNYCMLLPGPEAQQLATYLGWLMHGTWGGVAAGLLFILPGMALIVGLAWTYLIFADTGWMAAVLSGVKPAVVAIVAAAAWRIGSRALRTPLLAAIAAASLACGLAGVPFPMVIAAAALLGYAAGRWWPAQVGAGAGHATAASAGPPALIDDDTPLPAHATSRSGGLWRVTAVVFSVWVIALGACIALSTGFAQMGLFFTQAALLTFGGAYAVLPYVYDAAVERFQWLGAGQMMDGLALGETTPGPLILVVTFVGFLGGWQQAMLGPGSEAAAALVGAIVATFFTFLPSFLFILAGAPFVEATRRQPALAAPLAAITAAVVGVIADLGVNFARHAFWPDGAAGNANAIAVAMALVAWVALVRFRVSVPWIVLAAGLVGLALSAVVGWNR